MKNVAFVHELPAVCYIKDTLKAFDNFKNKQRNVWSNVFDL